MERGKTPADFQREPVRLNASETSAVGSLVALFPTSERLHRTNEMPGTGPHRPWRNIGGVQLLVRPRGSYERRRNPP